MAVTYGRAEPTSKTPESPAAATVNLAERVHPTAQAQASAADYRKAFELAFRLMRHKHFYAALNTAFAENVLKPQGQRMSGLALSQVVFILLHAKNHWADIELYFQQVPIAQAEDPEVRAIREKFRAMFDRFTQDPHIVAKLKTQNNPTQPLEVTASNGAPGFSSIDMFVNHPILQNPNDLDSPALPASDLHQLVINFIAEAKTEIRANVFDFDSQEIGDAFLAASRRGVSTHVGVDMGVFHERPEVQAVVEKMTGLSKAEILAQIEAQPNQSVILSSPSNPKMTLTLVSSVGLNHQKAIVSDVADPQNAKTLLLSGNFTYSCLHPNGDAATLPVKLRPPDAIPNANHAILLKGQLPAVVVEQELRKTLDYGVRGESQYPLGGAFRISGPMDPATGKPTSIILTFSPNGGLGDINRDILARLLRATHGPMVSAQFAFSSEILTSEIVARSLREFRTGTPTPFRSVGDPPFAMREWSGFLALSGWSRDITTQVYSDVSQKPDALIAPLISAFSTEDLSRWRESIRVGSRAYGERHEILPDGRSFKLSAKLHHKVWAFPDEYISVVGTSFNPSANAEKNNEQILIVYSSNILNITMSMFGYLYREARGSVAAEAMRRNQMQTPLVEPDTPFEKRNRRLQESEIVPQTCPSLFGFKKSG
ncbi:MAG: hypothetical protein NDI61_13995 [Bdellovibrionaceae bacterium]|nr:hypothetical protein [Pseudobdellovibrionaceae bacterium]